MTTVRVQQRGDGSRHEEVAATGGSIASESAPVVAIDICRCGRDPGHHHDHRLVDDEPDWPLATAWAWLTRPGNDGDGDLHPLDDDADEADDGGGGAAYDDVDPASLPWWDARSRPDRRRAVLALVLLGELQAGTGRAG